MDISAPIKKIPPRYRWHFRLALLSVIILYVLGSSYWYYYTRQQFTSTQQEQEAVTANIQAMLDQVRQQYEELRAQDQVARNEELTAKIKQIETLYDQTIVAYEDINDLKAANKTQDFSKLDQQFAQSLKSLADLNYESASTSLNDLSQLIKVEQQKRAIASAPQASVTSNEVPGSGYQRQQVTTDRGSFVISLVAGDLGSTRVIVDTASSSNCANDCPVLALGDYVARNGAFAGINGTYFCPASYPSCAGKTNSFDLLVMNKDKTYFNSDNNVYSNNPAVIFGNDYIRFVSSVSQWGRDTSPNGVLSNYPLLISGGNVSFGGNDDAKQSSKGNRSFVANKGNTVYIGVVHNATVAEAAVALKALGMDNALNLDSGGSTALWSGGYKVGPGRSIPNAILFVRK